MRQAPHLPNSGALPAVLIWGGPGPVWWLGDFGRYWHGGGRMGEEWVRWTELHRSVRRTQCADPFLQNFWRFF